ncbi:MAG: hypothetical protein CEN89_229 [Candidatus Berkelbacteria bacterium Licking1014_7]|uniref:50S ribosomal protein L7/L12 n=1 Tax=Candidatus Berkelbacteria bacterium Licking1014_7 TaxID=2017147 RepID=A0A554LKP9_9BACT|nr:MAG: hypothetical protein CEN89_229 [Candidatus Berkelbacteria bacterium Licking1014_7]
MKSLDEKEQKLAQEFEKMFSHLDCAISALSDLKSELFEIYQSEFSVPSGAKPIDQKNFIGVFDGRCLKSADKLFPVPENYISKSKIVEGDKLKLTIEADGSFIFKQIDRVERKKQIGKIIEISGKYMAQVKKRLYKVLPAGVKFHKPLVGDFVTIVLPREGEAKWAVIENKIDKN